MKTTWRRCFASAGFAVAICVPVVRAQAPPPLGSANSYAVLGNAVVNSGPTVISGNAGAPVSGFPPGTFRLGPNASDAEAPRARSDAATAYALLPSCSIPLPAVGDVAPGVYCVSAPFSGVTTLRPGPNPDALWIFVATAPLTVAPNAIVAVSNGGKSGNVWWKVAGSVTLGAGSTMAGTILATGDITLGHGASLSGRALSLGGRVTLDTNMVSLCCDPISLDDNGTPSGGLPPYTVSVIEGVRPDASQCGCFAFTLMATDALGCHGVRRYTVDGPAPVTITTTGLKPATACIRYEQKINANCGTFSGQPPPGLILSPGGVLYGTPTAAGTYPFDITATTACGKTATQSFTLIVAGNKLEIEPTALPNGIVGLLYRQEFEALGCPEDPFLCQITSTLSGLSPAGCTLSGIPKQAGPVTVTVRASDTVSDSKGERTYPINIVCPEITLSPTRLPDGTVGTSYTAVLTASPAGPPYTFAMTPDPLPNGLHLYDYTICGTPTSPGDSQFTVTASEYGCTGSQTYTIHIEAAGPCALTFSPAVLPNGTVGLGYPPVTLSATGGTPPYTFMALSGSLPAGLTLSSGVISGTPTAAGTTTVTIQATDANGCPGTNAYPITINPPPVFTTGVPALPPLLLLTLSVLLAGAGLFALWRTQ